MTVFDADPHAVTVMHEYGCDLSPGCLCGTPRFDVRTAAHTPATVLPCDHLPEMHDLRTKVTGLQAENNSLREQLHAKEERLAGYRHVDNAIDIIRGQHRPRPTYLSASSNPEHQPVVIDECTGCAPGTPYPCAVLRALDPVETT